MFYYYFYFYGFGYIVVNVFLPEVFYLYNISMKFLYKWCTPGLGWASLN